MEFRNKEEAKRTLGDINYYVRDDIAVGENTYSRLAIQTHFIEKGESYIENIRRYVMPLYENGDILSISEKVIAMCQNNTVDISEIKIGWWARTLAKFASSTPAGPGVSTPSKMQLAINLAGLPRIIWASICAAVGKIFGKKGVFYAVAGHEIAGIDGFYHKASFEIYKTTAILNPRDPSGVCAEIGREFGIPAYIVDANDLTREILGTPETSPLTESEFIMTIDDNPAGQDDELTPFILVRKI